MLNKAIKSDGNSRDRATSRSKAGLSDKIHLSITKYAFDTLEEDRLRFGSIDQPVSRDELYNTILLNSYLDQRVPAFLSREYVRLIHEWKKSSGKNVPETSPVEKAFVQACKALYLKKYPETKAQLTVNIYSDVLDLAVELENGIELQVFTTKIKYFTQILESYARLPYGEREGIFFLSRIKTLEKALGKTPLKIEHTSGQRGTFIPYEIKQDDLGLYWYVGGMMIESSDFDRKTPYSCSWRISRLVNIREDPRFRDELGDKEKADLERMISDQKIQYLTADSAMEIRFRVTEKGAELLDVILLNRPTGIRRITKEDREYICTATRMQAETYFQRLGREVEIISPQGLLDGKE